MVTGSTRNWKFSHQLRFLYLLIFAVFVFPFLQFFSKHPIFISPSSQKFIGIVSKITSLRPSVNVTPLIQKSITSFDFYMILKAVLILGILTLVVKFFFEFLKLYKITQSSFLIKKINNTKILVSSDISIPFSFWIPLRNFVMLPEYMLSHQTERRMAIAHELQHHRQMDTKVVYILQLLKIFCFWNPCVYFFERRLSHIQEFACDEALHGHQGFSSLAYCRCLLWVAEKSQNESCSYFLSLAMAGSSAHTLLKRRMELMLKTKVNSCHRGFFLLALVSLLGIFGVAFASNLEIRDRNITFEEAKVLFKITEDKSFPNTLNKQVLDQLNVFIGTAEGRRFMKESLQRMKKYKDMVYGELDQYQIPKEFAAVPIIESGYQNLEAMDKYPFSAGLWMFIPETAEAFGLRVDGEVDERLNESLETDAAMRYLEALYTQKFQDWGLALLAFNAGEELVQKGIEETGSRDVWTLINSGYEGDPSYIAKVVATSLILKNTSVLE